MSPESKALRPRSSRAWLLLGSSVSMRFRISSAGPSWPRARRLSAAAAKSCQASVFLFEPDINLGQPGAHGDVFRIHFQRLLENPDRLFQFAGAQKFFRDLQVLRPGIIKESLLGIELGQSQHALQAWASAW